MAYRWRVLCYGVCCRRVVVIVYRVTGVGNSMYPVHSWRGRGRVSRLPCGMQLNCRAKIVRCGACLREAGKVHRVAMATITCYSQSPPVGYASSLVPALYTHPQ